MDSLPERVAELNTSIQPALQSKAMRDVEHDISIYWKDQEMEGKGIDWKTLQWLIVSLWIDLSPTALQGDSRLAAAPFTPGALLVSHSNLGDILSPMQEATLVHRSARPNVAHWDLTYGTEHTNHTDLTPGMLTMNFKQVMLLCGCV